MDSGSTMQDGDWVNNGMVVHDNSDENTVYGSGMPEGVMTAGELMTSDKMNPEGKKRQDAGNIWKILTMVFGLLAIVGVSFGIVMLVNGNKQTEVLTAEVRELEGRNDDLLEQLAGWQEGLDARPIQLTVPQIETIEYIYIGEWKIKIRKPENWRDLIREYSFYNDDQRAADTFEISENPDVPTAHALIYNEGITTCESLSIQYDACFTVGDNAYIVTGLPEAGTGGVSDEFRNFVLNSENYTIF